MCKYKVPTSIYFTVSSDNSLLLIMTVWMFPKSLIAYSSLQSVLYIGVKTTNLHRLPFRLPAWCEAQMKCAVGRYWKSFIDVNSRRCERKGDTHSGHKMLSNLSNFIRNNSLFLKCTAVIYGNMLVINKAKIT